MAQQVIQLDPEKLSCSICLDLLKEPVAIPCGHNYCMRCIQDCWDEEREKKKTHSCPQCRQSFNQRPALVKNTMLAELVEQVKKAPLQPASPDPSSAGPGDVACDFCTGMKLKAFKSCLVCMASYCEKHLQPHYDVPVLKKHKLVEATSKLQENICSRHDEVMKIFCRTDQQCICYLCSMDDHKGHDTVSAAAERAERQTELGLSQQQIQQRIQDREKDVKRLQRRVRNINTSADKAVEDSEKIFTDLIHLIEKRSREVKQQIRSQQKTEVGRAEQVVEKLQQEITELRRKVTELEKLSHTEDHLHFLKNYRSLSHLSESKDVSSIDVHHQPSFEDVTAAVSKVRDKLQTVLTEEWANISLTVTEVNVFQPSEPRTRNQFLKYACEITLDPNTANTRLSLSDNDRKATLMKSHQSHPAHPDRFSVWIQVLSREGLTGRCYWEVKFSGRVINVAVAYKMISRTGTHNECGFGFNDKSWSLRCDSSRYTFMHNETTMPISGPESSKIGVYLDHGAGTLCFYSVSDTMTLLHKVQTTFTQPLHPGLSLPWTVGDTAELCELKQTGV